MALKLFLLASLLAAAAAAGPEDRYAGIAGGGEKRLSRAAGAATSATAGAEATAKAAEATATDSLRRGGADVGEAETRRLGGREVDWNGRRKRGYARWAYPSEQFQGLSFSYFRPNPTESLARPYFIPVFGAPGKIPIFFPPQPYYINAAAPPDNPMKPPYRGPMYLPPKEKPGTTTMATSMSVGNRNDGFEEDDDERPRWGLVNEGGNSFGGIFPPPPSSNRVPTRPPRPSANQPEFPPLIREDSQSGGGTNQLSADEVRPPAAPVGTRTTTARPRPRPPAAAPTTRAPAPATRAPGPAGPSNCVWAVISCCSASSDQYPQSCFEQRGCPGPFWDRSPCESDFAKSAIDAALNYYNNK